MERIRGALANLGHQVGRSTIARTLSENGLEPAPERRSKTSWQQFLQAHWEVLAAADFFTVEVWTRTGLVRVAVLFVIEMSTCRVEIAWITTEPDGAWMAQVARNLTDVEDGFLGDKRFLIHYRDPLLTKEFRETLAAAGVESLRLPARSPNLNAYAECFVRTIKGCCLERLILFGEQSLRRAIQ
jgi:transposase InsO family protein